MNINIEKLSAEIEKLNDLVSTYEDIYLKFYNEVNGNVEYWKDEMANYFFSNINDEELDNRDLYNDLVAVSDIYNYLIEKYLLIGKKININLDNKDSVLNKFDKYIDKLQSLINIYRNLDVDFNQSLRNVLSKQRRSLENDKSQLIDIRDKYKKYFVKIEEIEKQVKQKLSQISIDCVKENSIQLKKLGSIDGYFMDMEKVSISIDKLKVYKQEEDVNDEGIFDVFKNINSYYVTKNKENFQRMQLDLLKEVKTVHINHHNNITVLNNKLDDYRAGLESVKMNLNNFNGGSL